MAKSRNRVGKGGNKKHKKLVQQRALIQKNQKEKARREFMQMIENAQKETNQQGNIVEAEDLGIDVSNE